MQAPSTPSTTSPPTPEGSTTTQESTSTTKAEATPIVLRGGLVDGRASRLVDLHLHQPLRSATASDVDALKTVVKELEEQFGPSAVREVFALLRGEREVARFAAVEGPAGVIALHEARGNLPKAQALLAERYREPASASAARGGVEKRISGRPSLPPEAAGIPVEVAEAKLRQAEAEAGGARLPMDAGLLEKHRLALQKAVPPGAEVHALWPDYLAYLERRTAEIGQRQATKGPLGWTDYQVMRDRYARGLAFERTMVALLMEDAARPRAQRRWLRDFDQPRIETHVGVMKADLRFADVLVIEERPPPGQAPAWRRSASRAGISHEWRLARSKGT